MHYNRHCDSLSKAKLNTIERGHHLDGWWPLPTSYRGFATASVFLRSHILCKTDRGAMRGYTCKHITCAREWSCIPCQSSMDYAKIKIITQHALIVPVSSKCWSWMLSGRRRRRRRRKMCISSYFTSSTLAKKTSVILPMINMTTGCEHPAAMAPSVPTSIMTISKGPAYRNCNHSRLATTIHVVTTWKFECSGIRHRQITCQSNKGYKQVKIISCDADASDCFFFSFFWIVSLFCLGKGWGEDRLFSSHF